MKILVKANNWLGDAVMSLPTLHSLKAMYPKSFISVLSRAAFTDLYRAVPEVDEVLPHIRGGVASWVSSVRGIRKRKFDAALILPRSFSAAFLAWSARIPRRIGYGAGRGALLTDRLDPEGRQHRVLHYHHLLSALGDPPRVEPPRLPILPEAKSWAKETLGEGSWVALNPGATYGAAKQWLPDRFIDLGRRLSRGNRLVVIGGPAEAELGERVAREVGGMSVAGKTSISQLAALLSQCRLLVTNDTGPMHVADAVGTPLVAIFGPTDHVVTPPYGRKHTLVRHDLECSPCLKRVCPLGHHHCMKWVTVDEVERACGEWLR